MNKDLIFLCIDQGNTFYKLGVYKGDHLLHFNEGTTLHLKQIIELFVDYKIGHCILCEVKSIKESIKNYLKKHSRFHQMSVQLTLPVSIKYRTPETLGTDRLAAVCASARLFPRHHVLVIGIGTCITYDMITTKSEYLGGNISPGLDMRLKSMHHYTARLPLAVPNLKVDLIGNTTLTGLQSGALWGIQAEIQGMITEYSQKYPRLKVVLGGGGAEYYKNRLKKPIFAHPNLVILGLKEILSLNVQKS